MERKAHRRCDLTGAHYVSHAVFVKLDAGNPKGLLGQQGLYHHQDGKDDPKTFFHNFSFRIPLLQR
jgi:hypothetical protein